jgi:hypothetical protein
MPGPATRGERLDVQSLLGEERPSLTPAHISRKDGRMLKRMTLYLPADLARRLAIHCAEQDIDMSTVVTEAVRRHLAMLTP